MNYQELQNRSNKQALDGGRIFVAQPLCTRLGSELQSERCAIYVRETVSSESADDQMKVCTFFASSFNWLVVKSLVKIDVQASEAEWADRNGLSELINAAKNLVKPFTYLLISHPSVLSTDEHAAHALINLFNSCGVIVCSVALPGYLGYAEAPLELTMFL